MTTGESKLQRWLVKSLRCWDAVPVENIKRAGTPDVNCTLGWIECKDEREWPARADTVLRLKRYPPQQVAWIRRRWAAGGTVYILLQVGKELLLFQGDKAHHVGTLPKRQLCALAVHRWDRRPDAKALRTALVLYANKSQGGDDTREYDDEEEA